jgi:hypothetical protein
MRVTKFRINKPRMVNRAMYKDRKTYWIQAYRLKNQALKMKIWTRNFSTIKVSIDQ